MHLFLRIVDKSYLEHGVNTVLIRHQGSNLPFLGSREDFRERVERLAVSWYSVNCSQGARIQT